jgi:hypothetical protein
MLTGFLLCGATDWLYLTLSSFWRKGEHIASQNKHISIAPSCSSNDRKQKCKKGPWSRQTESWSSKSLQGYVKVVLVSKVLEPKALIQIPTHKRFWEFRRVLLPFFLFQDSHRCTHTHTHTHMHTHTYTHAPHRIMVKRGSGPSSHKTLTS